MTENNVAAQAGDEPMREAFFAWFAEHGAGHQYKESQDAFCAGYQVSPRATADVERKEMRERVARAIWNLRREEEDRCDMELEDMGDNHSVWAEADAAILATTKPGA